MSIDIFDYAGETLRFDLNREGFPAEVCISRFLSNDRRIHFGSVCHDFTDEPEWFQDYFYPGERILPCFRTTEAGEAFFADQSYWQPEFVTGRPSKALGVATFKMGITTIALLDDPSNVQVRRHLGADDLDVQFARRRDKDAGPILPTERFLMIWSFGSQRPAEIPYDDQTYMPLYETWEVAQGFLEYWNSSDEIVENLPGMEAVPTTVGVALEYLHRHPFAISADGRFCHGVEIIGHRGDNLERFDVRGLRLAM